MISAEETDFHGEVVGNGGLFPAVFFPENF